MKLDDLVLFAFNNGKTGDIFVQKAPAATLEQLASVLKKVFRGDNEIQIIGTRHGEKQYETLLTREEMVKAEDMKDYYRIVPDIRDLNYSTKFFSEGDSHIDKAKDYHSNNTHILSDDELEQLLLKLEYVQQRLNH